MSGKVKANLIYRSSYGDIFVSIITNFAPQIKTDLNTIAPMATAILVIIGFILQVNFKF